VIIDKNIQTKIENLNNLDKRKQVRISNGFNKCGFDQIFNFNNYKYIVGIQSHFFFF